jgi:hypothetical protein
MIGQTRTTSLDAILKLRDTKILGARQLEAWSVLFEKGPMTANEMEQAAGIFGRGLHKRLSELKSLGLVKEKEVRHCRVTRCSAIVWQATQPDPSRRIERPKKPRQFVVGIDEKGEPVIVLRDGCAILYPDLEQIRVREIIQSKGVKP